MAPRKNRRNMAEIIKHIKALILPRSGKKIIYDYEVAEELRISVDKLSVCKKRNVIPYEDLIYYCQKNNISADNLFFR